MILHELESWTHIPWVIQAAVLTGLILMGSGVLVRRRLTAGDGGVLPDDGVTIRNFFEVIVEWLAGMAEERIGPDYRKYFPLIGTMFFFILFSNMMGLIPGLDGATSSQNTTWAWAAIAWAFYTAIGVREHGVKQYFVKFMGPSFFEREIGGKTVHFRLIAPLFFPLEILLDIARMLTLSVRLLANMVADHTVIGLWLVLVPIGVPAVFMGLGLIIAFLQAFIFALLTIIYIGLALEEPH